MAKASKEKSKWFDKKNIVTVILLSVSFSFTVFFFSPVDIFLGNQKEFNINAYRVIFPLLILALLSSIGFMLIGILSLINRNVYNVVTSLLFGLLLMFYCQMMFFNGDVKLLDGNTGRNLYTEVTFANTFNLIVMYIILIAPLVLILVREKYMKDSRLLNFAAGKTIAYLSALIFAMQFSGSLGMLISNGLIKTDDSQYIYGFSFEPFMSVSEDGNIMVFLLDKMDGKHMDKTLEMYPEMNEKLEGFTFYQNNVSYHNNTFPSVPCMLTNAVYDEKETRYDFLERVWQENSLTRILSENNYRINLIIDRTTTFNEVQQFPECSNITQIAVDNYEVNYTGRNGIIDTMVKLSFIKISPYYFKGIFNLPWLARIGDNFLIIDPSLYEGVVCSVNENTDLAFNKYISENPLKADSEQKTFSFMHLNGPHNNSNEISYLYPGYTSGSNRVNEYTTVRGDFETLFIYFDMMKDLGVYDDSTIIIIADHQIPRTNSTSSLLIKPAHAEPEPLKLDSISELSNVNFFPSILEYAGIDHSEYGCSYNDIIRGEIHTDRYQDQYYEGSAQRFRFKITGDARDESNWTEIPLDK